MAALADLQARFAAALGAGDPRVDPAAAALADAVVDDGLPAAARLGVYHRNVQAIFETALARTYPVLRRRAGEGYFRGLCRDYRDLHPSRSGDLHWVGEAFPGWLATRLSGSEYAWLADLARLEWACEESLVAAERPPAPLSGLARIPAEALADTRLGLQAWLRLVESAWPVFSVWRANQADVAAPKLDLDGGGEQVIVTRADDRVALRSVPAVEFAFVARLAAEATLGEALEASALGVDALPATLAWLFAEGCVTRIQASPARTRA